MRKNEMASDETYMDECREFILLQELMAFQTSLFSSFFQNIEKRRNRHDLNFCVFRIVIAHLFGRIKGATH